MVKKKKKVAKKKRIVKYPVQLSDPKRAKRKELDKALNLANMQRAEREDVFHKACAAHMREDTSSKSKIGDTVMASLVVVGIGVGVLLILMKYFPASIH